MVSVLAFAILLGLYIRWLMWLDSIGREGLACFSLLAIPAFFIYVWFAYGM